MRVLRQEITEYISTNLVQPRSEWSDTTTYTANQEVTYKNHIYRSMVDSNVGVNPSLNTGKWLLFGVDNSFAGIDLHSLTASQIDDGLDYIEFEFASVGFTMLAFRGVMGASIDLYEYDDVGTQINYTNRSILPERLCSINWYNYYYCPTQSDSIELNPNVQSIDTIFDVILPRTAKMKIRINKRADGRAKVDTMVGGSYFDIGATRFGIAGGFIDHSVRKTDDYGITKITKRNVQETMKGEIVIDALRTQSVKRFIKDNCMGETVVFIADESDDSKYENLTMLGYITDFEVVIDNGVKSFGTIEIEESL